MEKENCGNRLNSFHMVFTLSLGFLNNDYHHAQRYCPLIFLQNHVLPMIIKFGSFPEVSSQGRPKFLLCACL